MNGSGHGKAPEKASDNSSGPYTRKTAAEATAFLCFFSLLFLAGARENIFQRVDDFADGAVVAAKRLNQAEDLINQCFDEIHTIVPPSKEYERFRSLVCILTQTGVKSKKMENSLQFVSLFMKRAARD